MYQGKVRTKAAGFLKWAMVPIFSMAILGTVLWFIIKNTELYFGVTLLAFILFLAWKWGLFRLYANILNPHDFTITNNGLISKDGIFIPWSHIKEIVFFNYGGYQHLGVKLKEGLFSMEGKPIEDAFRKSANWAIYKMPIVTMTDHLIPSWRELVTIFKDDYKVPVRSMEKEVKIGEEGSL
ncbi:MAG TPA: hypothetical protein VJZ16_00755 [Syntrophales bacterium]|nr:hypothetical protein [Syntrophales bacterium]